MDEGRALSSHVFNGSVEAGAACGDVAPANADLSRPVARRDLWKRARSGTLKACLLPFSIRMFEHNFPCGLPLSLLGDGVTFAALGLLECVVHVRRSKSKRSSWAGAAGDLSVSCVGAGSW